MIGIIVPANLKYAPYVNCYVNKFKKDNIPYEIITWNRGSLHEDCNYAFEFPVDNLNRKKVLIGYFRFTSYVKKIINKRKYSSLIVFTAAMGFFLSRMLEGRFEQKYIFDIRDDSVLVHKFPEVFKKVCKKAYSVSVSSMEFASWVPCKVVMSHNADKNLIEKEINNKVEFCSNKEKMNIVSAGLLVEKDINIALVELFRNDVDVCLKYIGTDNEQKLELKKYVKDNHITNVSFQGTYQKEEIVYLYRKQADFVNVIRDKTKINEQAIPNKLYDAAIAGRPVIVMRHNKAVAEYVEKYNLGIVLENVDLDEIKNKTLSFKEKMINTGRYRSGREEFLKFVREEILVFERKIDRFVTDNQ